MNSQTKLEIYMMYEKGDAFLAIAQKHNVTVRQAADACSDVQTARQAFKDKVKVVSRKRIVKKDKTRQTKLVNFIKEL